MFSEVRKLSLNQYGRIGSYLGLIETTYSYGYGLERTVTVNGSRKRVRVTVRATATERSQDPSRGIRGRAKNSFITRALAPPPFLAISSSCSPAFLLSSFVSRVKEW